VTLMLITGNQYFDAAGTALIGLLLVLVAITLAIETKSLLLGEAATPDSVRRIEEALTAEPAVERVIHMRTLHLGPEELLVAAKIAVHGSDNAGELARAIDSAEQRIRSAVPIARVIYLEPDVYSPERAAADLPR